MPTMHIAQFGKPPCLSDGILLSEVVCVRQLNQDAMVRGIQIAIDALKLAVCIVNDLQTALYLRCASAGLLDGFLPTDETRLFEQ